MDLASDAPVNSPTAGPKHVTRCQVVTTDLISSANTQVSCSMRARRSRKDRPCDHCRLMKQLCRIVVHGESCSLCQKARKSCTFAGPPPERWRGSDEGNSSWRGLEPHETSGLSLAAQACEPRESRSPAAGRKAATGTGVLNGFLDSLMGQLQDVGRTQLAAVHAGLCK